MRRLSARPCGPRRTRRSSSGSPACASSPAKSLQAPRAGDEPEALVGHVTDEADPAVAEREQVTRRERAAVDVVDHHAGQTRVLAVEQHDRCRGARQPLGLGIGRGERDHQQPVVVAVDGDRAVQAVALLRRGHVDQRQIPIVGGQDRRDTT